MNKNSGTTNLVRPSFGPGMLLQHQDLELLGSYTRDLSRMLFKSFFGCGVVCGLKVTAVPDCGKLKITITRGLALTCSGDPIEVAEPLEFLTDLTEGYVVLCRSTRHFGPRTPMCDTGGESSPGVCTREIDCYKVDVKSDVMGYCGCPDPKNTVSTPQGTVQGEAADENHCYDDHMEGDCGCGCSDCSKPDSGCVVLAKLVIKPGQGQGQDQKEVWVADHRVRRFIRPALLPDRQAEKDGKILGTPKSTPVPAPPPPSPATKAELQHLEEQIQTQIKEQEVQQQQFKAQIEEQQVRHAEELRIMRLEIDKIQVMPAPEAQETTATDVSAKTVRARGKKGTAASKDAAKNKDAAAENKPEDIVPALGNEPK